MKYTIISIPQTLTLRQKLLLAFFAVIASMVALAAAAVALQTRAVHRAAFNEAQHVATEIASVVNLAENGDQAHLQHHLVMMGRFFDRGLTVLDSDHRVIASTKFAVGSVQHDVNVEEVLQSGITREVEVEQPGGRSIKEVVAQVAPRSATDGNARPGAVIVEYTQGFDQQMQETWQAASVTEFAAVIVVMLTTLFAFYATSSLVDPLRDLQEAADAIAAENFDVRVNTGGDDEVSRLASAFNAMADKLSLNRAALHQRNEDLAYANLMLQDKTEKQKIAVERVEYLAFHDSLTALPNRARFNVVLAQAVEHAERYGQKFSVFFIDLDRFKQINDTLGHDAGDLLLREVGKRLAASLGQGHTVARLGGDEFVVLLNDFSADRLTSLLAQQILTAISRPIAINGQELRVTASIGISRFGIDGSDELTLMKHADIALYQAKENGRNGFAFYSHERNGNSFERLALECSLRRAIGRNELLLHYQPKRDLVSGAVTGMEALLRWQHPDLGLVSPAEFIPVAEDTGLIVPIGKWVLRTACLQTAQWRAQGLDDLVVAVNLSPRQFTDDGLLLDIVSILNETGMDATRLELEITETAIMQNPEQARKMLASLKSMGIRIAVDDFGTGYSSLSTLKQFPIDTLKIDRSFIRDLATDVEDRSLTEAIISMGKALKLHLIAEGVETAVQEDFLRQHGCHAMQGYHFSRPIVAAEFETFVKRQRRNETAAA